MITTSMPFYSSNLGMVSTEIQPSYQLPNRTCAVILIDQLLDVDRMQKQLGAIDRCKARRKRRGLHACSLAISVRRRQFLTGCILPISSQLPVPRFPRPQVPSVFLVRLKSAELPSRLSPLWLLLAIAKLPVRPSEHILHLRQVEGREAHRVGAPCHRENKRGRFSAIDLHRKQGVIAIA
jgi:hypothetical protein